MGNMCNQQRNIRCIVLQQNSHIIYFFFFIYKRSQQMYLKMKIQVSVGVEQLWVKAVD